MAEQEAESRPPAQEVVGRTTSDAVTEITREVLRLLGRAAPTVVFLAMVVFGVYKFFELQNEKLDAVREARLEAQAENLATITALKDTVLRDASTLSQLQQSNVQVINEQLAQHQSILRLVTENQQRVAELTREEAERRTELEAQATELATLRETLDAATRNLAASAEEEKALLKRIDDLEMTTRVADHLVTVLNAAAPLLPSREPAQIAERYEGREPGHVGWDHAGNTYYGTFRIRGALEMKPFIDFLQKEAPHLAQGLLQAGGVEAATEGNAAFQQAWRRMARDPEFEVAQRRFIHEGDYRSAVLTCKHRGGWDISGRSIAVQSVVWSMAVQHGSAAAGRLCIQAANDLADGADDDAAVIETLYRLRREKMRDLFPGQDGVIYRLLDIRYTLEESDARRILARFPPHAVGGG